VLQSRLIIGQSLWSIPTGGAQSRMLPANNMSSSRGARQASSMLQTAGHGWEQSQRSSSASIGRKHTAGHPRRQLHLGTGIGIGIGMGTGIGSGAGRSARNPGVGQRGGTTATTAVMTAASTNRTRGGAAPEACIITSRRGAMDGRGKEGDSEMITNGWCGVSALLKIGRFERGAFSTFVLGALLATAFLKKIPRIVSI
jgi:hypothetical protein